MSTATRFTPGRSLEPAQHDKDHRCQGAKDHSADDDVYPVPCITTWGDKDKQQGGGEASSEHADGKGHPVMMPVKLSRYSRTNRPSQERPAGSGRRCRGVCELAPQERIAESFVATIPALSGPRGRAHSLRSGRRSRAAREAPQDWERLRATLVVREDDTFPAKSPARAQVSGGRRVVEQPS